MFKDLKNMKFGKLTVIERIGSKIYPKDKKDPSKGSSHHALWRCLCDCGNISEAITSKLKNGNKVSCGCHKYNNLYRGKGKNHNKWCGYGDISGTTWGMIRSCAKQRGLIFDISIEEAWDLFIKQNKKCAITGVDLVLCVQTKGIKNGNQTASLDRIDSSVGYTLSNIQWVHRDINQMKWDLDQDKFINWCKIVAKNN